MKYIILFFVLIYAIDGCSQFSVFTENTDVLIYDYDENRYKAKTYSAIGLSFRHDIHANIFYESRLKSRFDRGDGLVLTNGIYFNRTPQYKRFLFLTGIGFIYDGYNELSDYYVEARIRLNMGPLAFEGSGSFNLKENFKDGPTPTGSIRVVYSFDIQKLSKWK